MYKEEFIDEIIKKTTILMIHDMYNSYIFGNNISIPKNPIKIFEEEDIINIEKKTGDSREDLKKLLFLLLFAKNPTIIDQDTFAFIFEENKSVDKFFHLWIYSKVYGYDNRVEFYLRRYPADKCWFIDSFIRHSIKTNFLPEEQQDYDLEIYDDFAKFFEIGILRDEDEDFKDYYVFDFLNEIESLTEKTWISLSNIIKKYSSKILISEIFEENNVEIMR